MNKRFLYIVCALGLLCSIALASVYEQINERTLYFMTSDQMIKVAWDEVEHAVSYDIEMLHVERNVPLIKTTRSTSLYTTQLPKSGHYIFMVRGVGVSLNDKFKEKVNEIDNVAELKTYVEEKNVCDHKEWFDDGLPLDELKILTKNQKGLCSAWASSINPSVSVVTIGGQQVQRAWWVYAFVAPPSSPVIK